MGTNNTQTVQDIYAAFGRGDVPAILARLADDVEWEYGPRTTDAPWLQPRRGRDAVAGFFEALGLLEITKFNPHTFLESGDTVVALIDLDGTVKATGKSIADSEEIHIWHFASDGKVARYRHGDRHLHHTAYKGS